MRRDAIAPLIGANRVTIVRAAIGTEIAAGIAVIAIVRAMP